MYYADLGEEFNQGIDALLTALATCLNQFIPSVALTVYSYFFLFYLTVI